MKYALIYHQFMDARGLARTVGGVQTYLWNLSALIADRGGDPVIVQSSDVPFEKRVGHVRIVGVPGPPHHKRRRARLYHHAMSIVRDSKGVVVFGADHASVPTDYRRSVSIQHGVSWDLPGRFVRGSIRRVPFISDGVRKKLHAFQSRRYFENCSNRVCVDYNFLNWYRTQVASEPRGTIWVIPNFVSIPDHPTRRAGADVVRIVFARRFIEYRGSRLMIAIARRLLSNFSNVGICFAGEGPDEELIRTAFAGESRVTFRRYLPDESVAVHSEFDIAVVPSLASEGTSLSLAEAMAAGCAVVASNVGGMTNMIVESYNGRLVNPAVDEFVEAISELIVCRERRLELGKRAAETARGAFSLKLWRERWSRVLDQIAATPL